MAYKLKYNTGAKSVLIGRLAPLKNRFNKLSINIY